MKEINLERAQKPRSWYESSQTPEWFNEPADIPWAATPLNPYTEQHDAVSEQLERLYSDPFPDDVPLDFQQLVHTDYLAGKAYRDMMNVTHFNEWVHAHDGHGPVAQELIECPQHIGRSPEVLLEFIRENSVQATELAKLSVPYGYRIKYIPELREKIDQAVLGKDGSLLFDQPYGHIHTALHRTPDLENLAGILATYQRDIGQLSADDGSTITVTERQALAIRTDRDSGFPADLYHQLANGSEDVPGEAMDEIEAMIQSDANNKYLVPLSITFFAHREKQAAAEQKTHTDTTRENMASCVLHETIDQQ